jgi:hypothetical protein
MNKAGTDYLSYRGSSFSHDTSTAAVFGGLSEKINVTNSGLKNFSTTGLSMTFSNPKVPNGDVWVSRSTINPDELPDALLSFNTYWAVDNYGVNQIFTKLSALKFTDDALNTSSSVASTYKLYKRSSTDFGATWGTTLDTGDSRTGTGTSAALTFSTGLDLTSLGQMTLSQDASAASLSVKEKFKTKKKPIIHPNPLKSNTPLIISVSAEWENSTLFVFDTLGRLMVNSTLKKGVNEMLLNVPMGVYSLKIVNQNDAFTSKLLVK